MTALCTLNRALLSYTEKQAADNSQKPPNDGQQADNGVEGQCGPAWEVAELLSLLASLFRLGSPFSQVRECPLHATCPVFHSIGIVPPRLRHSFVFVLPVEGLRHQEPPPSSPHSSCTFMLCPLSL